MSTLNLNDPNAGPQFNTAEYKGQAESCKFCGLPISGSFYRVSGQTACPNCAQRKQAELSNDSNAFTRAVLLGVVGALVGMALYAGFEIATNLIIGYVSLAVGFIVAKAMMIGSGGVGGRKYQITAVILTYLAVSLSIVVVVIWHMGWVADPLFLLKLGVTSPFTELSDNPTQGLIGLVILAVGIRIAWKVAEGKPGSAVQGPFTTSTPAATGR